MRRVPHYFIKALRGKPGFAKTSWEELVRISPGPGVSKALTLDFFQKVVDETFKLAPMAS